MRSIILASASPRRREILRSLNLEFSVFPSGFDEGSVKEECPVLLCQKIAQGKCESVMREMLRSEQYDNFLEENYLVLSADTMVFCGNYVLGKPKTRKKAKDMLSVLSNSEHKVITSLCCADFFSKKLIQKHCVSRVTFKNMTDDEIEFYLDVNEWKGVAGGYRIQGRGAFFVKSIEGSHSNIVGLPIYELYEMLKEFDFCFDKK